MYVYIYIYIYIYIYHDRYASSAIKRIATVIPYIKNLLNR